MLRVIGERDKEDMLGMMLSSGFGEPLRPRMVTVEEGVGGSDMYTVEQGWKDTHGSRSGIGTGGTKGDGRHIPVTVGLECTVSRGLDGYKPDTGKLVETGEIDCSRVGS